MTLEGKTIAVTGVASGIGAACAAQITDGGGRVVGLDLNEPDSANVEQFIQYDQSDAASIDQAVAALPDGLNGLLNIAGVPPSAKFDPTAVLKINFVGLRYFTEAAVGKLADGAGIVNMSSGAGNGWPSNIANVQAMLDVDGLDGAEASVAELGIQQDGFENSSAYPFSKQCLTVWTMLASSKWSDRGIRVNAIAPAAVETPIIGDFMHSFGSDAATRMETFGAADPADIAKPTLFLLSTEAAWINGAILATDNGAIAAGTCKRLGLA